MPDKIFPVNDPASNTRPLPPATPRTAAGSFSSPELRERLFGKGPAEGELIDEPVAVDRAFTEAEALKDPGSVNQRVEIQRLNNVEDLMIQSMTQQFQTQGIEDFGALEGLAEKSPVEKTKTLNELAQLLDWRKAGTRNIALFFLYGQQGDNVREAPVEVFDGWRRKSLSGNDLSMIIDRNTNIQRLQGRRDVSQFMESEKYLSLGHAFASAGAQELTPVYNVVSKIGLTRAMLEAIDAPPVEGFKGWMTGEINQAIRTHLDSLGPTQYKLAVKDMLAEVDRLERSGWGWAITRYNVREQMDSIFTGGVLSGGSAENNVDRWVQNVEVGLEALFTAWIGMKAVKALTGKGFRAASNVTAFKTAQSVGDMKTAARLQEALQDDVLAAKFGLETGETVPMMLPKPHVDFVDNMDELAESTKAQLVRTERQVQEIQTSTEGFTGAGLNVNDKANVMTQTIEKMDIVDEAYIQPRMSTIRMFDNDTGFRVEAVVGETAERGFKTIEDVSDAAMRYDPLLENMEIVRVGAKGTLEPVYKDGAEFFRATANRKFPASTAPNPPYRQDFYLRYKQDRFWNQADKSSFLPSSLLNAGNRLKNLFIAPNAKFGPEIYGSFLKNYMSEQQLVGNLETLFNPYYKLSQGGKRNVGHMYEWGEDFAKDMVTRGDVGRAPTLKEMMTQFQDVTTKELEGYIALRRGMDSMHELFNRRLYREWQSQGYMTARPVTKGMPTYHGLRLDRSARELKGVQFLDPNTGDIVRLSKSQLDDLYNTGGSVMKLDMAVDSAKSARSQADLVIVARPGYEIGELSMRPLKHMPNYTFRFYDDPYYVVKRTAGMKLNGKLRTGERAFADEAIWTAGTKREGMEKIARIEGEDGVSWHVVNARDVNSTESVLLQKQALQREGRLFWDERNVDRLPDVNGNRARLMDPVKALERGIAIASRQLAGEDLLKSMKGAFEQEFKDLVTPGVFNNTPMDGIVKRLKILRNNMTDKAEAARVSRAIELVNYFRLMEGVDAAAVPALRKGAQGVATAVTRWVGANRFTRGFEKYAQTLDPFRTMRSVAFNAFMVFRPVRQAILQSAQIGFLAPLAPVYVGSGAVFKDALLLRRGLAKRMKSAYDDGITSSVAAKGMGMTKAQYAKVIEQFDRSGLMRIVDVHSFGGGARLSKQTAGSTELTGYVGYKARALKDTVKGAMQKWGFNFGENNNLTFTFALALKRASKKHGKDVLKYSQNTWDEISADASNMALGMVRVNNFAYQQGALGVATQFLSFSHKAALALVGQNPALKGQAIKLIAGTYLLYGGNMYGAQDWADERLTAMGLRDMPIPGVDGGTLVDLISAGVIDTTFNKLWDLGSDDYKDIDFGFLAPGFDFNRILLENLEALAQDSVLDTAFGPFGNIFSKTMTQFDYVNNVIRGNPDMTESDKFVHTTNAMMRGIFPAYNDAMAAYTGYQLGVWLDNSGDSTQIRSTYNGMIARGLFGGRTKEELAIYAIDNKLWESESEVRQIVRQNQQWLNRIANEVHGGRMSAEVMRSNLRLLANLYEGWPEAKRQEILERSLIESINNEDSPLKKFITGVEANFVSPDYEAYIDRMVDIPPEQRHELKIILRDAYAGKIAVDQQVLETIEE